MSYKEKKMSWLNNFISLDTAIGLSLGGAAAWFLWSKLDEWTETPQPPRSDRRFSADELSVYDGNDNRLAYVAIGEEVFDVSKDKDLFKSFAGKQMERYDGNMDELRKKYYKVGTLIIPRNFTAAELAEFDGSNGKPVYLAVKGVIYDVDPNFYGPDAAYGMLAGRDATRALALVSLDKADVENPSIDDLTPSDLGTLNEWIAKFEMKYNKVGTLVSGNKANNTTASVTKVEMKTFLNKERQQVVLHEKIELSHDTRLFRFKLPEENMRLGLPIGKHIKIWCPNPDPVKEGEWNGQPDSEAGKHEIERKYTPSSLDIECNGSFDVVIKVYKKGVIERFPDGGKMSQHLESLSVGDTIDFAGPYGLIEYKGNGLFNIKRKERKVRFIGMLAGGTGITPMLQLIKAVLRDPNDDTKMSLIFANQTEADILVRDMLEAEATKHPERFKLHYTLDRPPTDWSHSSGFITADMINTHMPPPSEDTVILMCGPPPMIKFACKANLDKLGYDKNSQIEF